MVKYQTNINDETLNKAIEVSMKMDSNVRRRKCTTVLITIAGLVVTCIGAVACLGNMGPGFGLLGPTANFGWLPDWTKWMLSMCMFLGRLEIFTVLIVFVPNFWRK